MPAKTIRTSDGVSLTYTDEGTGQPVLLVHGMLCHGGHWKFQRTALLEAGYRVISPDLRFHSKSESPEHGQRISRIGQDLAELIAAEGLHDVAVVSHSMGFSATLAYVSLHGAESLRCIVGIDQSPRIVNDESWQWGVRHITWSHLEGQIGGRTAWSEPDREPPAPLHVAQMLEEVGGIDDFFSSPFSLRIDHFTQDWRDVVPMITVPLWIVTSEHSPSFPIEGMQWTADTAPHGLLTVYTRSGHCPHWNEYQAFNTDLLQFLSLHGRHESTTS